MTTQNTISYEGRTIILTQDASGSNDAAYSNPSDYPHGAYEANGYDAEDGESCTVFWEALGLEDGGDDADWDSPINVRWSGYQHNDFDA